MSTSSSAPRHHVDEPAALLAAIKADDAVEATRLLVTGASACVIFADGDTALHWASRRGLDALLPELINRGADVNQPNAADGITPLLWACYHSHPSTALALIEAGADVRHKSSVGNSALKWCSLRGARMDGVAAELRRRGASEEANPALAMQLLGALKSGMDVAVVQRLVAMGADLRDITRSNSALVTGGPPNVLAAIDAGDFVAAAERLSIGGAVLEMDAAGRTALFKASALGHAALLAQLIECGASVDAADETGATPLSVACAEGHATSALALISAGAALDGPRLLESCARKRPLMDCVAAELRRRLG